MTPEPVTLASVLAGVLLALTAPGIAICVLGVIAELMERRHEIAHWWRTRRRWRTWEQRCDVADCQLRWRHKGPHQEVEYL